MRLSTYKNIADGCLLVNPDDVRKWNMLLKCKKPIPKGKNTCLTRIEAACCLAFGSESDKQELMAVACRQCHPCKHNWHVFKTTRIMLELAAVNYEAMIFTLTMKPEFHKKVPFSVDADIATLDEHGIKKWIKRMRYYAEKIYGKKIKIIVRREYGRKKPLTFEKRDGIYVQHGELPHYHVIVIGIKDKNLVFKTWTDRATGELMCDPDRFTFREPKEGIVRYLVDHDTRKIYQDYHRPFDLGLREPEGYTGLNGTGINGIRVFAQRFKEKLSMVDEFDEIPDIIFADRIWPIDRDLLPHLADALDISEDDRRLEKFKRIHYAVEDVINSDSRNRMLLGIQIDMAEKQYEIHKKREEIFQARRDKKTWQF